MKSDTGSLYVEVEGDPSIFAIFEEDNNEGFLSIYDQRKQKVIAVTRVYQNAKSLNVQQADVQVLWSTDQRKCGVIVWKKMRAILDLADRDIVAELQSPSSPGITDPLWLSSFDYLDIETYVEARKRYWREAAERYNVENG
jgi:hypothetical protein